LYRRKRPNTSRKTNRHAVFRGTHEAVLGSGRRC
jgi:hypothetical protein